MDQLGDLLKKRLNQHKLEGPAQASQILYQSAEYLKKWLSCDESEVRVATLEEGVLWIEVVHSVWSQEVWGVKERLLAKLQSEYGEKIIGKICIKSLTIK